MQLELILCFCMMMIAVSLVASVTVRCGGEIFPMLAGGGVIERCVGRIQVRAFHPE